MASEARRERREGGGVKSYTIQEFHPVDGYFALIDCDGDMIAKTWDIATARRIVAALKVADKTAASDGKK